jgi:hypothetical protein
MFLSRLRMLRFFIFCLFFGLIPRSIAEEIRRIAILSDSGLEDAAAVLTGAFSATPGIELVEREQLSAAAQERNLQVQNLVPSQVSALGKMLGAQAILVLSKPTQGTAFSCRLIAANSGLTISETKAEWPIKDLAGWASLYSRQFSTAIRRVPQVPGTTALVVSLGVRSPTTGPVAQKLERNTSFAVERSLVGLSGVFVLDRTRMREASWEKELSDTSQGEFWSGTWLLDGNIQDTGSKLIYEGQLRPISQAAGHPIRVEARNPEEIGRFVAAAVADILGAAPTPAVSDAAVESKLFEEQAAWALRWELYEEAERAADASWLLGNRSEAVGLIRSLGAAQLADSQLQSGAIYYPDSATSIRGMETLCRSLSNLLEAIPHSGQEVSPEFLDKATKVFAITFNLLKRRCYNSLPQSAEEVPILEAVRSQMRQLTPLMIEKCQRAWKEMTPEARWNTAGSELPLRFYVDYLMHSPLLGDTPEESAKEFEKSLTASDELEPDVGYRVRQMAHSQRQVYGSPSMPIVVAWNAADQSRLFKIRNQLLDKLLQDRPDRKLEACLLGLLPFSPISNRTFLSRVPEAAMESEVKRAYKVINDLLPQVVSKEVNGGTLLQVVGTVGQIEESYQRPSLSALVTVLQKELLLRWLQAGGIVPRATFNELVRSVSFAESERDQAIAAIRSLPGYGSKNRFLVDYEKLIVEKTNVGSLPEPVTPQVEAEPGMLPVAFRYSIGEGDRQMVEGVIACDGRFLVRVNDFPRALRIFELDPQTGGKKTLLDIANNSDGAYRAFNMGRAWTADKRFIYLLGEQTICRIDRATGAMVVKQIALLPAADRERGILPDAVFRLVLGQLYIVQSGALIRIDPTTLDAELLASAKRRPAQTVLDDRAELTGTPIELGGNMAIFSKNEIHLWNAATRNFDTRPFRINPVARISYDRNFVLRLQPQLSTEQISPDNEIGYWITGDPNRTGFTGRESGWHPYPHFRGRGGGVEGISAGGSVLYVLLRFSSNYQRRHLMAYGPAGNFCAPLEAFVTPKYSKVTGIDGGVLVWGYRVDPLFYRFKDLEKFPE